MAQIYTRLLVYSHVWKATERSQWLLRSYGLYRGIFVKDFLLGGNYLLTSYVQ